MEKPLLEEIIKKLKARDVREWACRGSFNGKYWPYLGLKLGGLSFELSKDVRGNPIRMLNDYSLNITLNDHFVIDTYCESSDTTDDVKPIGCLYNAVYKDLKNLRQKEFTERINSFSAKNKQQDSLPLLEEVITKLAELEPALWEKYSYLDKNTIFSTKTHGLTFTLELATHYPTFKKDIQYHRLSINNNEEDFLINYGNKDQKSHEEKKLSALYKKLDDMLKTYYQKEFKKRIDELLSE